MEQKDKKKKRVKKQKLNFGGVMFCPRNFQFIITDKSKTRRGGGKVSLL
jgi:hypothetical protein